MSRSRTRRLLTTIVLGFAYNVAAQTPPAWVAAPTLKQVAAAYPPRARADRAAGRAELSCRPGAGGRLRDCGVVSETPGGYGFGAAARRLAEASLRTTGASGPVHVNVAFRPDMLGKAPVLVETTGWAALPSAADFQASFPKAANGVNHVRVLMACDVAAGGALANCALQQEEPAGLGYGAAVLALAPKFRAVLWTRDGLPTVGARVKVPIRYELRPTAAAAPK